ncbi:MAG: alpha/beta fold hydrolase [Bradyrhizobium sp.]|nr:alpha/beta fold hydrolase [Bradyrhizobium sp.]
MTSKAQASKTARMERDQPSDRTNAASPFAVTVRHMQFSMIDAFRHLQGNALAALGFGPDETPYRVITAGAFWRLRDYGSGTETGPVLIVAAPIKRPYIWDLTPDVSVVRRCLAAGLHVHLLEWLPASQDTCAVGMADCSEAIATALKSIADRAGNAKPALLGHSLGGTLAGLHAASAPSTIAGLVLLGSPLCFRPDESPFRDALVTLVPAPVADSDPYPGSILSQMSAVASPNTFVWSRWVDAALSAADRRAMSIHARVERWALDEVALPGKLVSEIVEWLYRENRFGRGVLQLGEQTIGPKTLSVATLAVVNTADAVAPVDSVSPLAEALGPEKFTILTYPGEPGVALQHLGILVGREAHAEAWPKIIDWIKARP